MMMNLIIKILFNNNILFSIMEYLKILLIYIHSTSAFTLGDSWTRFTNALSQGHVPVLCRKVHYICIGILRLRKCKLQFTINIFLLFYFAWMNVTTYAVYFSISLTISEFVLQFNNFEAKIKFSNKNVPYF